MKDIKFAFILGKNIKVYCYNLNAERWLAKRTKGLDELSNRQENICY